MSRAVGLIAGEASGDLLGAELIAALKSHKPELQFEGIAGPKMTAAGALALASSERLSVNGYVEVLRHLPGLLKLRRDIVKHFLGHLPRVFVGIDAPDFNFGVEERLKAAGIPTVHFVSPSIWAWRGGRINKIRRAVSHILALFPFETPIYEKAGIPVTYVGHPLADILPMTPDRAATREMLGLPAGAPIFALLPGSRQGELRLLADTFIETAKRVAEALPNARFLVPLATRETRLMFEEALYRCQAGHLPLTLLFGHAHDAMIAADGVLVASGTATLEAALLKRPMVIAYKLAPLSHFLMKRMAYLPYVGLPNVLAGRFVVPEFIQNEATPEKLAEALLAQFADKDGQAALTEVFEAMHLELKQGTAEKAAKAILSCLRHPQRGNHGLAVA